MCIFGSENEFLFMDKIQPLSASELTRMTSLRSGEVKFGERMETIPKGMGIQEGIEQSEARFVILGIPEDIGIKANFGRSGAASTWKAALQALVNIQHNRYCKGSHILVIGALNLADEMAQAATLDPNDTEELKKLRALVALIDKEVTHWVRIIVSAGKVPILIGGGHNNAYGAIKGTALAVGKPIHAINFDAHSDFRQLEGRHSGNGFSYAFEEGFLKKYALFGLHENYLSKNVMDHLKSLEGKVLYNTYEDLKIRRKKATKDELHLLLDFVKHEAFGVEIDLDAIEGVPSSAMTLSGFSVEEARQYMYACGLCRHAAYLHICEGAVSLGDEKNPQLIGKLISYLITDFIKAKREHTQGVS